jgi:hypothetical protein
MGEPFSDASAWESFCARLADAGREIPQLGPNVGPLDTAGGFEHLAELLQMALLWYLNADPDYPRFITMNDTFELADNRFAAVRGGNTYVLRGNASTLYDVNISLHEGWAFLGEYGVWGDLGLDDLTVDDDGSFELVIGPEPRDGNWLELPPQATILHIREYYADWDVHRPGTFEIIRVGSEGSAPDRMDGRELAHRLDEVLRFITGYTPSHLTMINWLNSQPPNIVQIPTRQEAGNRNIAYAFGRFDLDLSEALVLEFPRTDARLWGAQWLTTPWYENPDLANRSTSVRGDEAFVNDDGKVRVVVSATDPGTPNWLDIGGYREGVLAIRWIWIVNDGPGVDCAVVPTDKVVEHLPGDTPKVDPDARADEQARRRASLARRRR